MESVVIELAKHYIGQTVTDRLKEKMQNHMLEEKYKIFGYTPRIMESVLATVHTTEKYPELKGVSTSPLLKDKHGKIIPDLLLDNFGLWLAGIFHTGNTRAITLVDNAGISRTVRTVTTGASMFNDTDEGAFGIRVQIGADPATVTRSDFKINLPFSSAPQSGLIVPAGASGWNIDLGVISISASIVTAVTGGSIQESGLLAGWETFSTATVLIYMLAHDNISPALIFLPGETVNINYTFTL